MIVQVSNTLAIIGLAFLALAMVGVVWLITDVLYGGSAVATFTVATAAVFIALWYAIPLLLRLTGGGGMPPRGVKKGTKRARQYEKVKKSVKKQGKSEGTAEEIAARVVNKERAARASRGSGRARRSRTSRPGSAAGSARVRSGRRAAPRTS